MLALFVPESPVKFPTKPDYAGGLTLSLALGTLLVAISEGTQLGLDVGRRARPAGRLGHRPSPRGP